MNNFIFENTTKVYFGKGCVREYLSCLVRRYEGAVLFACDEGVRENGIYDEVLGVLKMAGKDVIEFAGITEKPTYEEVLAGAGLVKENNAGFILGVGGNSVMDCCKAISIAARYRGDAWKDFWRRPGVFDFEPLPVGVIATAACAGSACNGCAAITHERLGVKIERDYPQCDPKFALLDPDYTRNLSKERMLSDGFDILSYMMEIYFSDPDEDNVSDDLTEALMKSVIRNLRIVKENPDDYTARSNLMWDDAMMGNRIIKLGKAMGSPCHQIERRHSVCACCGQGRKKVSTYPTYYHHVYKNKLTKFKKFALNVWNVTAGEKSDDEIALAGIEALESFARKMGVLEKEEAI